MEVLHRAIAGIGSNVADKEALVADACARMRERLADFSVSALYITPAEGGCAGGPDYCNAVAEFSTADDFETLNAFFKELEALFGRTPADKAAGRVPLDIDIVVWDGRVLRPRDMEREYMRIGLRRLGIAVLER